MTQEFNISVTPVGHRYLVRTEQVAPGVPLAEELVTWPVADWLTQAGQLMNDPLKSVLQGGVIGDNSVNLISLGQQLYNALFQGTLRDSWITAQGIAQNQQQVLRLRLGLKDTRLARLPWEVMHAGDRPLATGPYVAFSRYQSGTQAIRHLPSSHLSSSAEGGVKVLMAIASPSDQVRLNLLGEAKKLKEELQRRSQRSAEGGEHFPEIELILLEQPGREELTQALEQGLYDIFHYAGHSNLGPNGGEIYLVNNRTGLSETLSGDDLAGLLVNNSIQMAVFNSCLGAYTATSDPAIDTGQRNLSESLVKRGIASVLAMAERIPDEVALTLTQLFYRNLSQGYPADLCVSRVRQGLISAYGSGQMYWALPILYLQQQFDGYFTPETRLAEKVELLDNSEFGLMATPAVSSAVTNDTQMPLPMEEMIPLGFGEESGELDWLEEEDWDDIVDEIEYDSSSYEEDSAIVSDLFRELDSQKAGTEETKAGRDENAQVAYQAAGVGEVSSPPVSSVTPATPATPATPVTPVSSVTPATPPPSNTRRTNKLLPIVGIVGISAIALLAGVSLWFQNRQLFSNKPTLPPIPASSQPANQPVSLQTAQTPIVTAIATENFNKGDLNAGLKAVEELLDRNALNAAKTALDAVPQSRADTPKINFLKGRLAWQAFQLGDEDYSVDDARRYWETAMKADPNTPVYHNALGFAYYTEGKMNQANESWFKALYLAGEQQGKKGSASATAVSATTPVNQDALTAYAGLALALNKSAPSQPPQKREQLINEAIKLRQMVLRDDPVRFQPENLAKNWLWTEKAIQDWRSLLQKTTKG